jgi:hypothetical protein
MKDKKSRGCKSKVETTTASAYTPVVRVDRNEFKLVEFQDLRLGVIEYDGEPWVTVPPVCDKLGIDRITHFDRIMREGYPCRIFMTQNEYQNLFDLPCLAVSHLFAWLRNLNSGWLKYSAKPRLAVYRRELQRVVEDFCGSGIGLKAAPAAALEADRNRKAAKPNSSRTITLSSKQRIAHIKAQGKENAKALQSAVNAGNPVPVIAGSLATPDTAMPPASVATTGADEELTMESLMKNLERIRQRSIAYAKPYIVPACVLKILTEAFSGKHNDDFLDALEDYCNSETRDFILESIGKHETDIQKRG